jgi:hypothetical protein
MDKMFTESSEEEVDINNEEITLIDAFLSRFLLTSDSTDKGQINLKLALKALPKRFNDVNIDKVSQIFLIL